RTAASGMTLLLGRNFVTGARVGVPAEVELTRVMPGWESRWESTVDHPPVGTRFGRYAPLLERRIGATGHGEQLTGDVTGLIREQEQDGVRDVVGLVGPSEWDVRRVELLERAGRLHG